METLEKPTQARRIILFENEDNQKAIRSYVSEQKSKLFQLISSYNLVRASGPALFPEFSFAILSEILRAKNGKCWIYNILTNSEQFQWMSLLHMDAVAYPAGTDQLLLALKITPADKNFMEQCFIIAGEDILEVEEAIEKKIDACRRYCNHVELEFYEAAERIVEANMFLLKLDMTKGFLPSLISLQSRYNHKCMKYKFSGNEFDRFEVNPNWIIEQAR